MEAGENSQFMKNYLSYQILWSCKIYIRRTSQGYLSRDFGIYPDRSDLLHIIIIKLRFIALIPQDTDDTKFMSNKYNENQYYGTMLNKEYAPSCYKTNI